MSVAKLDPTRHVHDSKTCFVCQCDTDNEYPVCRSRGARRSVTRNMQDSHNVCLDCLPVFLRNGEHSCGICRQGLDWDFITRIPEEDQAQIRRARIEGEEAEAMDWDTEFTEQMLEHEQSPEHAEIFVHEGMIPIFGDGETAWTFWHENRYSFWATENIPEYKQVLWNELEGSRETEDHCLNTLHFLALTGYHEQFEEALAIYNTHGDVTMGLSTDRLHWALPRILFDVFQVSKELPWIDNSGRFEVGKLLLEEYKVSFHEPVCDGKSTLELYKMEPWVHVQQIVFYCRRNLPSLPYWGSEPPPQQIHFLRFRTATNETVLHLLMARPITDIIKQKREVRLRYKTKEEEIINLIMYKFLEAYSDNNAAFRSEFMMVRNNDQKTAMNLAIMDEPNILSIQKRHQPGTSLDEWSIKTSRLWHVIKLMDVFERPSTVDVAPELHHYMLFVNDIMAKFQANATQEDQIIRSSLPYGIQHYVQILASMGLVFSELVLRYFQLNYLWFNDQDEEMYSKKIDVFELLVTAVRLQNLKSVKEIVNRDRFGGDLNRREFSNNPQRLTLLHMVNYFPMQIPNNRLSTPEQMTEFLLQHGAHY